MTAGSPAASCPANTFLTKYTSFYTTTTVTQSSFRPTYTTYWRNDKETGGISSFMICSNKSPTFYTPEHRNSSEGGVGHLEETLLLLRLSSCINSGVEFVLSGQFVPDCGLDAKLSSSVLCTDLRVVSI